MENGVTLTIDGRQVTVEKGKTVLQASIEHGIKVPYYCYHPGLGIDGSCRVCLVKIEKMPKLQTACSTPAAEGMVVMTETPDVVEEEKRITAYHEAGHTLVASMIPECDPVHKVTIIPRGRMGGATMSLPERDQFTHSKRYCEAQLAMAFGGRVAEELFFSEITSGASNDIQKATELARRMVCQFGMSPKLGPISYSDEEEHLFLGREIARTRTHSEETAKLIDSEIHRFIETAHQRARDIVSQNREKLEAIAQALLKYELISGEEVRMLLRGEKIDELKDAEAAEEKARLDKRGSDSPSRPATGWKPGGEALPGPQQA